MYDNLEFDEFTELLESDEMDEATEFDERARPRRPMPRLPKPPRGNAVPKPVGQGFATKAALQATANRLDGRIGVNTKAISTLEGRVGTLASGQTRIEAAIKKAAADRQALRKSVDDMRQIAMILPLLSSQETRTVGGVENVVVDTGDDLSKMLPILMMSGGFGGSGTSGGGDGNNMMMLAMVVALSGKK